MAKSSSDHVLIGIVYIISAALIIGLGLGMMIKNTHGSPRMVTVGSKHHRPRPVPPFTFPDGGRELAGKYRMVALYGTTDSGVLGVLGEQPLPESIARAKQLAAEYQPFSTEKIYPAFEIIASVASAGPTEDGDYSRESDPGMIKPWIDEAKKSGVYVVLDLQPGREDFLSQAKQYESLLGEPHVGLALDPEWRLSPNQVHLEQIGSVGVDEVNATSQWLAGLTKQRKLPQKLFLLHQFRPDMIAGRERLIPHPELATLIQMDGQGAQSAKNDTWNAMIATPPPGVQFGWKNFLDEDQPVLSPEATMQHVPQPWYVSYQ